MTAAARAADEPAIEELASAPAADDENDIFGDVAAADVSDAPVPVGGATAADEAPTDDAAADATLKAAAEEEQRSMADLDELD